MLNNQWEGGKIGVGMEYVLKFCDIIRMKYISRLWGSCLSVLY
jgi:hypothetical protein